MLCYCLDSCFHMEPSGSAASACVHSGFADFGSLVHLRWSRAFLGIVFTPSSCLSFHVCYTLLGHQANPERILNGRWADTKTSHNRHHDIPLPSQEVLCVKDMAQMQEPLRPAARQHETDDQTTVSDPTTPATTTGWWDSEKTWRHQLIWKGKTLRILYIYCTHTGWHCKIGDCNTLPPHHILNTL